MISSKTGKPEASVSARKLQIKITGGKYYNYKLLLSIL